MSKSKRKPEATGMAMSPESSAEPSNPPEFSADVSLPELAGDQVEELPAEDVLPEELAQEQPAQAEDVAKLETLLEECYVVFTRIEDTAGKKLSAVLQHQMKGLVRRIAAAVKTVTQEDMT